jgi:putative ABC transport system permease protein
MNLLIGTLAVGLLVSLATLGVLVTFRVLHTIDLTAEGAFGVGAAVAAAMLVRGAPPFVATGAAVGAGVLAGLATGLQHTRLRIDTLLAGILTSTALYSVMLYVMGGGDLAVTNRATIFSEADRGWRGLGGGGVTIGDTTVSAASVASFAFLLAFVPLIALLCWWFFRTRLGLAARAAGDSPTMAQAQGIDVGRMIVLAVALSNGLVGLSGALFAQYQGFANVQMALGTFVAAIGCIVLGEALLGRRGVGRQIAGAILGTVAFRLLVSGALRLGLDPNALKLATATFVVIVLVLQRGVRRALAVRAHENGVR